MANQELPRAPMQAVCQVCGTALEGARPVVSCSECGTPHHQDCWEYVGGCSTFACGGRGRAPRAGLAPSAPREPDEVLQIDGTGQGRVAGQVVALPKLRRNRTFPAPSAPGARAVLTTDSTRLDLDTPLEKALQYGALGVFIVGWMLAAPPKHSSRPPDWPLLAAVWPVASALLLARMGIDCTYVLDNEARALLYSRSLFGLEHRWRVCDFSGIRDVRVEQEHHTSKGRSWYTYYVTLQLPSGERVAVSNETTDRSQADGLARRLASHVGVRAPGGQWGGQGLLEDAEEESLPMGVEHALWRSLPLLGRVSVWWLLFFVFTVVMNCVARFD